MKKLKLLAGAVLICASFQASAERLPPLPLPALPSLAGLTALNRPLAPVIGLLTAVTNRLTPLTRGLTLVTNGLTPVTAITGRVLVPILVPVLDRVVTPVLDRTNNLAQPRSGGPGLLPALPGLPS